MRPAHFSAGAGLAAAAVLIAYLLNATALAQRAPPAVQSGAAPRGEANTTSLGKIFDSDLADFTPEGAKRLLNAARNANASGVCPLGRVKIVTRGSADRQFAEEVARARWIAVHDLLARNGLDASRFDVDTSIVNSTESDGEAQFDHDAARDREKPTLHTSSVPTKGKKVKAGDEIRVTITASDDANRWQTGIETIQLLAVSEGNRSVAAESWRPVPRTCEDRPPQRRLETVYVVPANPPPVVRLRAIAEDFAGHHDSDLGEFPTSDWFGTLESRMTMKGPLGELITETAQLDLALNKADNGTLSGTLSGTAASVANTKECKWTTRRPASMTGTLTGFHSQTPERLTFQVDELEMVAGIVDMTCKGGYRGQQSVLYSQSAQPGSPTPYFLFRDVFERLKPTGAGGFETTFTRSVAGNEHLVTIKLRRAEN